MAERSGAIPPKVTGRMTRDPFEVLGLPRTASVDQIRSAYRRLAQLYHPDRNGAGTPAVRERAEQKMKELNVAYDALVTGRYAVNRPGAGAVYRRTEEGWVKVRDAWSGFANAVQDEMWTRAQHYSAQVPPPPSMWRTMREAWDTLTGRESRLPPLTVEEVAARLRISPRTVYRMLERGILKGVRNAGGFWRVPVDALATYLMGWEFRQRRRESQTRP